MRRRYERKEESHVVKERISWDHPSYEYEEDHHDEVSNPIIHKMVHNPSFQNSKPSSYGGHHDHDVDGMTMFNNKASHCGDARGWCGTPRIKKNEHQLQGFRESTNYGHPHGEDDMAFGGTQTRGWSGSHRVNNNNNNLTTKKNEHLAMGAKSGSILRPPLGSVNPPTPTPPSGYEYNQNHHMYEGSRQGQGGANRDEGQYYQGEGSNRQSMSALMVHNKSWMQRAPREYEEDYNHGSNSHDNWMKGSYKFDDYDHHGNSNNTGWVKASNKFDDYDHHGNSNNTSWMKASNKFDDYDHHGSSNNTSWMKASKKFGDYDHHGSSNNTNWTKAFKKFGDYDHDARLTGDVEALIKGLSGLGGGVVHRVEVIEYERRATRQGGGGMRTFISPIPPHL